VKCRVVQGRRKIVHYMVPVIELCSCVHVYQVYDFKHIYYRETYL